MLRYLATIGYAALALISIFLVSRGDNPWLWIIVIAFSPLYWFYLVGVPAQWEWGETFSWLILGAIGAVCFVFLCRDGVITCPSFEGIETGNITPDPAALWYLIAFWGAAGVSASKVFGTAASWFHPDRYTNGYFEDLNARTPDWHWFFALVGVAVVIWQLVRM